MNTYLEYKDYLGSVEVDVAQGILYGKLLFLRDVVSYHSEDVASIETAFRAAVDDYLQTCDQLGEQPDVPCKGSLNVRVGPELHKKAAVAAHLEDISLNEWIKSAFVSKLDNSKTAATIESASKGKQIYLESSFEEEAYISHGDMEWQPQNESRH